jgi:hypothetical protein
MLPIYSVPVSGLCCEPLPKLDMLCCVTLCLSGEQCHQWSWRLSSTSNTVTAPSSIYGLLLLQAAVCLPS